MGTRCLTAFEDENGEEFALLYRQYDGYPEGHGAELAEFLEGKRLVNGMSGDESKIFNGMGCLAASVVAHFKDGPGSFYLYPPGTRDCWEEFVYRVFPGKDGAIRIEVTPDSDAQDQD
jgi:hypothetical protein